MSGNVPPPVPAPAPPAPLPPAPPAAVPVAPTVAGGGTLLNDTQFDTAQAAPAQATTGWTRAARAALTNEGLVKFREAFAKKIVKVLLSANLGVSSYKPSEMEDKNNFFNAIASWSNASLQFEAWFRTHFVLNVFHLVHRQTTTAAPPVVTIHQLGDLFKIWNTVTLEQVFLSCENYFRYSSTALEAQNLNLSWEFIMLNIDSDLRAAVNSEISGYIARNAQVAQSGPMAYYVIANRIIRTTEGLAHNVVTGLMSMGLVHFKGENVIDCVATLRNVLLFLGHGTARSQTPPTLMKILYEVFLRCSNPVFVTYVRTLKDFHSRLVNNPEELFTLVQDQYNQMLVKPNGWLRTTKNRSAFYAELPELAAIMEDANAAPAESNNNNNSNGNRGNRNRGNNNTSNAPTTAGSTATPATNNGTGRSTSRRMTDRKGNPIDRTPPTDGNIRRVKADGNIEYWCGHNRCLRWGSHDAEHHDAWWAEYEERQERFRNRGNGNGNNNNSNASGNSGSGNSNNPPSMLRATFCSPIASVFNGDFAYESDSSF